ncbi:hypothetical protein LUZ61_005516 [Rhynchospora tenuis]|uniref:Protein kinase domain-containing protein n=1 Tax=Rhynchospora tenuis TaxID=198213 RepID=A0AAD5ZPW9_9POAL|nr:hypothetical protein LUZ61_005516 [Rhynchospora tenuis]
MEVSSSEPSSPFPSTFPIPLHSIFLSDRAQERAQITSTPPLMVISRFATRIRSNSPKIGSLAAESESTRPDSELTRRVLKPNLSGNSFSCPIPDSLQKKSNSGLLLLTGNKCTEKTSRKAGIHVIGLVITAVVAVLLLILAFIVYKRRQDMQQVPQPGGKITDSNFVEVQLKTQKFTKKELEKITGNFMKVIGGGGFGSVFSGTLKDGTTVAVKKLSESSDQGPDEFLTEAQNLSMLHHKNLLLLVGYCEDPSCLALIYEYMSQGTLEDHIRGNRETLSWRERLRIALEAAEGLEYMHKGCRTPIVHRDVKSSNILLGENLEAKVSDLGLARAFRSKDEATITKACGTRGYADPEYFRTNMLTVKSDVYSFGIVLLEIITGLPPIIERDCHLLQHINKKLQSEDITSVIDRRLEGDYDVNSVWKVFDLAMSCTQKESARRPTMSQVVAELKESLDLETHYVQSQVMYGDNISISGSMHSNTDATGHIRAVSAYSVNHASPSGNWENEAAYMLGPSVR